MFNIFLIVAIAILVLSLYANRNITVIYKFDFTRVSQPLTNTVDSFIGTVSEVPEVVINTANKVGEEVVDTVTDTVNYTVSEVTDAPNRAYNKITDVPDNVSNFIDDIEIVKFLKKKK